MATWSTATRHAKPLKASYYAMIRRHQDRLDVELAHLFSARGW